MDEDSSNDTFDYEQFLLAEQVRKYYYHGLYPAGIFVIWTLLRADCYNLSGCDSLGNPPILYASKCGSVVLLRLLLHYKADINALSKLQETALIVACRNKQMRATKLLLKRGAQTDLQDRTGYSALRWAVIHQHVDMVKLLVRYNASVTKDCYTLGSAIEIARQGTSKEHAIILVELEKKLVVEREALLVGVVERKKQDAIAEIHAYREKQEAKKEAEKDTTTVTNSVSTSDSAAQSTAKATRRSQRQSSHKVVAGTGISRRPTFETSVGTRVPTPLTEQVTWESLLGDNDASSEWVKIATGKWQTRKQEIGISISSAETTTVQVFAPEKTTVCKLLTSDGKWKSFLAQQMPHKVSQAQLTIEDLEASGEGKS